jgi:hypothetical protein
MSKLWCSKLTHFSPKFVQLDQLPGLLHHLTHSSNSSWACSFQITEHQERPGLLGHLRTIARSVLSSSTDATCISFASHLFTQANWWTNAYQMPHGFLCWVSKRSSKYTMNQLAFIQIHYVSCWGLLFLSTPHLHLHAQHLVQTSTLYRETKSFVKKKTISCAKVTPGVQCFISQQISVQDTLSFVFPQFCEVGRLVIIRKRN